MIPKQSIRGNNKTIKDQDQSVDERNEQTAPTLVISEPRIAGE